jgi:hypothetical protein
MMPKRVILICIITLLTFSTGLNAQLAQFTLVTNPSEYLNRSQKAEATTVAEQVKSEHAYVGMGIKLDPIPLPDLLRKHLGLSSDQGVRITNIHRDSPADKAGLERDDIIIGFQGKDVNSNNALVSAVRQAGVGAEVSLEIVHLGQRKTIELKLEASNGKVDLKYPPEPELVEHRRPGKAFKYQPEKGKWVEIPIEELPSEMEFNITIPSDDGTSGLLNEVYVYRFTEGGETCTITIEGNPNKDDTEIIVRVGKTEYKAEVGAINTLPEKYRASVEESLGKARKASQERIAEQKVNIDKKENFPLVDPESSSGSDNNIFDRIEKQMQEFQNRLERLEEQQRDFFERFSEKAEKQKSPEPEKTGQDKI